jgi:hypothetical protein
MGLGLTENISYPIWTDLHLLLNANFSLYGMLQIHGVSGCGLGLFT